MKPKYAFGTSSDKLVLNLAYLTYECAYTCKILTPEGMYFEMYIYIHMELRRKNEKFISVNWLNDTYAVIFSLKWNTTPYLMMEYGIGSQRPLQL